VAPEHLPALIAAGRQIKHELDGGPVSRHPRDPRLSGIYGTVFYDELGPRHQRSVAIFADGEVDRSPTGSATSARTALLLDDGSLAERETWRADSIINTTFMAQAVGHTAEGVLTEVEGIAFRTGEHRFVLDPRDALGTGFVLR
jgi:proline racemase/trans-L-3-hydroxyproline dehydratase